VYATYPKEIETELRSIPDKKRLFLGGTDGNRSDYVLSDIEEIRRAILKRS
jgi:hypothetical protein